MVSQDRQRGSVFITTILVLAVIAALGYALNTQVARLVTKLQSRSEWMNAQYLAQAGLRHHLWQARNDKGNYQLTASGNLVDHGSYSSVLVKDSTSNTRVHITSTGTSLSGQMAKLARTYDITCTAFLKTTTVSTYDIKGEITGYVSSSNLTTVNTLFSLDNNVEKNILRRGMAKFDPALFPGLGTIIVSASLILPVVEHDPTMDGGKIYVNRVTKPFWDDRVNWTDATGKQDKWATPGGDYTLVNEGEATIASDITAYNVDITNMVSQWVSGSVPNDGLVIRTNAISNSGTTKFKISNLLRIEIRHC